MAKFNYSKKAQAGSTKPTTARSLKTSHRKVGSKLSLKEFARSLPPSDERVTTWFHNKRVATSKGPLGIGATRKKKKTGSSAVSNLTCFGPGSFNDPGPMPLKCQITSLPTYASRCSYLGDSLGCRPEHGYRSIHSFHLHRSCMIRITVRMMTRTGTSLLYRVIKGMRMSTE